MGVIMDQPKVRPLVKLNKLILITDFIFKWKVKGKVRTFRIPKGFVSDGASIPRAFWTSAGSPFQPMFLAAAFIHDFIYDTHSLVTLYKKTFPLTRKEGDQIYRAILKANGVNRYLRNKHYWALRGFGMLAWKKNGARKKNAEGVSK